MAGSSTMKGIKALVSILLLLALLYYVGIFNVIDTLLTVDIATLALVFPIFILSLLFGAIGLKILYDSVEKIGVASFFKWYSVSWAVGGLLPGKFGDFSLAIFFKDRVKTPHSVSIIFLSKFVSLILSSAFAFIMLFLFLEYYLSIYLAALLVVIIAGIALLFGSQRIRMLIRKKILRKYESRFEGFAETFNSYFRHQKKRIAANTLVTFLKFLVTTIIVVLLFQGFGYNADFLLVLLIIFTTNIISMIPITINGLGLRQGAFVYLTSLAGFPVAISTSVTLISVAINYVFIFTIFLLFQKEIMKIKINI